MDCRGAAEISDRHPYRGVAVRTGRVNPGRVLVGKSSDFIVYASNSLIVGLSSTALVLLIGAPAAYSLAWRSWSKLFSTLFLGWALVFHMIPPIEAASAQWRAVADQIKPPPAKEAAARTRHATRGVRSWRLRTIAKWLQPSIDVAHLACEHFTFPGRGSTRARSGDGCGRRCRQEGASGACRHMNGPPAVESARLVMPALDRSRPISNFCANSSAARLNRRGIEDF